MEYESKYLNNLYFVKQKLKLLEIEKKECENFNQTLTEHYLCICSEINYLKALKASYEIMV